MAGTGRCVAHRRAAWRAQDSIRPNAAKRLYGHAWRKARLAWLAKHPLCAECQAQGRTTAAIVVDHIVPHKGDRVLFWDSAGNWASMCKPHHDAKTARETFGR